MPDLDFESDRLQLLTEALRAGPGTPVWRDAMAAVGAPAGEDEFKQLYAARERLASGREYREVRPGAGFTRKVLASIENEGANGTTRRLPWANLIAGASAVVIVAVAAMVAFFAFPRAPGTHGAGGGDLSQTYFTTTRMQTSFDGPLSADWSAFGPLRVDTGNGLRPQLTSMPGAPVDFQGGGVVYQHSFPPGEPFAVEATIRAPKSSEDLITQLFLTDDASFSGERATSPHELVWLLRASEASVALPDGTIAVQGMHFPAGREIEVRIAANRTQAMVETNGRRLWTGPNQLAGDKPRVLGIRFLVRGAQVEKDAPVVESVKILAPQTP